MGKHDHKLLPETKLTLEQAKSNLARASMNILGTSIKKGDKPLKFIADFLGYPNHYELIRELKEPIHQCTLDSFDGKSISPLPLLEKDFSSTSISSKHWVCDGCGYPIEYVGDGIIEYVENIQSNLVDIRLVHSDKVGMFGGCEKNRFQHLHHFNGEPAVFISSSLKDHLTGEVSTKKLWDKYSKFMAPLVAESFHLRLTKPYEGYIEPNHINYSSFARSLVYGNNEN